MDGASIHASSTELTIAFGSLLVRAYRVTLRFVNDILVDLHDLVPHFASPRSRQLSYPSVDKLQMMLGNEVFAHCKDVKKASGRALGTLVEIVTFYTFVHGNYEIKLPSSAVFRSSPTLTSDTMSSFRFIPSF
jgi:hypothetical protein